MPRDEAIAEIEGLIVDAIVQAVAECLAGEPEATPRELAEDIMGIAERAL
jgi:hypothetical protein